MGVAGVIDATKEGDTCVGSGKKRFDQFEIANRDGIEDHAVLALVESDAIYMIQSAPLCRPDVVENRSRRRGGRGLGRQPEAFER